MTTNDGKPGVTRLTPEREGIIRRLDAAGLPTDIVNSPEYCVRSLIAQRGELLAELDAVRAELAERTHEGVWKAMCDAEQDRDLHLRQFLEVERTRDAAIAAAEARGAERERERVLAYGRSAKCRQRFAVQGPYAHLSFLNDVAAGEHINASDDVPTSGLKGGPRG
jgi:hypothetical protein